MSKADAVIIAAIEAGVPSLIEARALVDRFQAMVRTKNNADLDTWITEAKTSLVSSFGRRASDAREIGSSFRSDSRLVCDADCTVSAFLKNLARMGSRLACDPRFTWRG